MDKQLYAKEACLQKLLADHPDLLSADGEPRRWLLISREFGIASEQDAADRFSVDHLFIDEQATPTLVEVKRSTDTRIRREVVRQMLEYAANGLSHWKLGTIRARFEAECDSDPADVLSEKLGCDDPEDFWERVETNLTAGRVRLMFVGDSIPNELRAIVEFLNEHMPKVEVLAVELKQYLAEGEELQILVPHLIGDTQVARHAKGRAESATWDRASWLAAYRAARGEQEANVIERIFAWADRHDPPLTLTFGRGAKNPGVKSRDCGPSDALRPLPRLHHGICRAPLSSSLSRRPPFDDLELRRDLQTRLNALPEVSITDGQLEPLYPSFPLSILADCETFERFLAMIDWVIGQVLETSRRSDGCSRARLARVRRWLRARRRPSIEPKQNGRR